VHHEALFLALLTDPWVISGRGKTGRCPPMLSMARAIRASGERNPNATRVMRRILVLTDTSWRYRSCRASFSARSRMASELSETFSSAAWSARSRWSGLGMRSRSRPE
jgi:hypothetical protein